MNAAPASVICEKCGYPTGEPIGEDGVTSKVGRCCENLPVPYDYDSNTGRYTLASNRRGYIAEDGEFEEDEDACDCPDCVADRDAYERRLQELGL